MRLLLGHGLEPHLLVYTDCQNITDKFKFWAINGNWRGTYENGVITSATYDLNNGGRLIDPDIQILCSDQELLSGEYEEVFEKYDSRMSKSDLKTYEEFASVYTKRSTIVNILSLVEFFDLYRPNQTTVKDLISYLTDLELEYPDKELIVNDGYNDELLIDYIKEETDEEFEARIRKSYNAYVARQNQKKIKKAETREDKIKALESEIERLKTIGE